MYVLYTPADTTEEQKTRLQIIMTRIYMVLLIVLLFILVIYISLVQVVQTITIESPSYDQYLKVYEQYPQSLTCPCSVLNIRHDTFVQIEANFHHICDSIFVSDNYLSILNDIAALRPVILQSTVLQHWRLISLWCELSKANFIDGRQAFYTQELATSTVLTFQSFEAEVLVLVELFRTSTIMRFQRALSIIRDTTNINGLWSGHLTNAFVQVYGEVPAQYIRLRYNSYRNDTCRCLLNSSCTAPLTIYDYNLSPPRFLFKIPGLLQGCYGVEATLQSSLECYYNQTCLDTLHFSINPNMTMDVSALDFTRIQNRFTATTPLYQFTAQMLIETWSNTSSHTAFFHHCQPSSCSYSYVGKNNLVVIITTIISLIGGLNTILKFVISRVTDLVRKWQKRYIQAHPIIQGKRLFIVSLTTR